MTAAGSFSKTIITLPGPGAGQEAGRRMGQAVAVRQVRASGVPGLVGGEGGIFVSDGGAEGETGLLAGGAAFPGPGTPARVFPSLSFHCPANLTSLFTVQFTDRPQDQHPPTD